VGPVIAGFTALVDPAVAAPGLRSTLRAATVAALRVAIVALLAERRLAHAVTAALDATGAGAAIATLRVTVVTGLDTLYAAVTTHRFQPTAARAAVVVGGVTVIALLTARGLSQPVTAVLATATRRAAVA